jgi:predicted transcriptional regulator
MATSASGVLSPDDLNGTDERVLDVLRGGRVTPQYVSEQLDVSRTYASERLKRLVEHGHVEKVAPGLYELVEDPRGGQPSRPYSWGDVEAVREFLTGIEEQIEKREQGEIEDDVEQLRENKRTIESKLEEILDEVEADEHD